MSNNTLENSLQDKLKNSLTKDLQDTLNGIRIVMVQTSHTGNIGAAARAMKVMGLSELYLVNPKSAPDEQSVAMSSNATDILDNAIIVETLSEAITGCKLVVGTSARHERTLSWDIQDSRSCGELIAKHSSSKAEAKVAVLFGRESSGLTNEELSVCQHLVHIPTNPDYSSLNIASAVQILSYECRLAAINLHAAVDTNDSDSTDSQKKEQNKDSNDDWVTADDLESYFEHLKQVMIDVDFLDPENPRYLIPRLRRLYSRSGITRSEMNILRGMLASIQKKRKQ
ncbi:MAG: TrmH family RNA methyltransferase [Cocleimonas sp.]|jgi:TrmH family RNA methyltransferase